MQKNLKKLKIRTTGLASWKADSKSSKCDSKIAWKTPALVCVVIYFNIVSKCLILCGYFPFSQIWVFPYSTFPVFFKFCTCIGLLCQSFIVLISRTRTLLLLQFFSQQTWVASFRALLPHTLEVSVFPLQLFVLFAKPLGSKEISRVFVVLTVLLSFIFYFIYLFSIIFIICFHTQSYMSYILPFVITRYLQCSLWSFYLIPFYILIPCDSVNFTFLVDNTAHFSVPKSMATSSLNICTESINDCTSYSDLLYNFKSFVYNKFVSSLHL